MAASHTAVWQRARVVENIPLTTRIRRIVVESAMPVRAEPGSHLDVRISVAGETVVRSYSIVDGTGDGTRLAVSVFEAETSRGGAAVMHGLRIGDTLEMTQPLQDFPLRFGAESYVLLAGGVGITAIAGMASALANVNADYRLAYCGRSRRDMAYVDALESRHGERLELHVKDEGSTLSVPEFVRGIPATTEVYMCGPIRLMDAVRRAWIESGLSLPNLRFETFGNSGWHEPEPFVVRVPSLGVTATVPANATLLEALENAGVDALFDCRKGECGLCEARVTDLDGTIDHRDVFYSERQRDASSRMCICVSRVCSSDDRRATVTLELS